MNKSTARHKPGGVPVDLHLDGVLWLINRVVFHPRGFALAMDSLDGTFHLMGDGSEVWTFTGGAPEDDKLHAVEALLARAALEGSA